MEKTYSLVDFVAFSNLGNMTDDEVHVSYTDENSDVPLSCDGMVIDFYIMSMKYNKVNLNNELLEMKGEDQESTFLYFAKPNTTIAWKVEKPLRGYNIAMSKKYYGKQTNDYNFLRYKIEEALQLEDGEQKLLNTLFEQLYQEYNKENVSKDIIAAYINLLLAYINTFYKRQFESRKIVYEVVVSDFKQQLANYYKTEATHHNLPTVAYFASKANLSPNYFGDMVKYFTGKSAQHFIQQQIVSIAKEKLLQTDLPVSTIAYDLGFNYTTYFTRFFKKEIGITPTEFKQQ